MDNPNPVPCPTGLVVKKGSNMRGRLASGIPSPVSATSITACSAFNVLAFHRFLEPVCLSVPGPPQLKGTGIGDLQSSLVNQSQVNEYAAVFPLKGSQFSLKKCLVSQLFQLE